MNPENPEEENIHSTIIQYGNSSNPIKHVVDEEVVPELLEELEADPDGQVHKLPEKP
jgi:hypothetical protein